MGLSYVKKRDGFRILTTLISVFDKYKNADSKKDFS